MKVELVASWTVRPSAQRFCTVWTPLWAKVLWVTVTFCAEPDTTKPVAEPRIPG